MLPNSNALPSNKKDAFTSVAIAVCLDGQIAMENHALDNIHAAFKCIIAIPIASSTRLMVIIDPQIAY